MKTVLSAAFSLFLSISLFAQLPNGPRDPTAASVNTSVGSYSYSFPTRVFASDESRAFASTFGYTHYLQATDFNFGLNAAVTVMGIEVEVERRSLNMQDISILDGWTNSKITPSFESTDPVVTTNALSKTVSAGSDRMLVVAIAMENGLGQLPRDLTALTYGGQAMTQLTEYSVTTGGDGSGGFTAKVEVWYILESGIASAGSTNFNFTFNTYSVSDLPEYTDMLSAASFQYVDQNDPFYHVVSNGATNVGSLALPAINTLGGSMTIVASMSGANPGSASDGSTNNVSINNAFTEGTDVYFSNNDYRNSGSTCCETSGAVMMTAHKSSSASGTVTPTVDYSGTANRQVNIGISLRRVRNTDHSVRLLKGGALVGSDYAQTTTDWPNTDQYTTYGGPNDLWGTTWTPAEINNAGFGVAVSTHVQNGEARIDHIRITVYTDVILPVRLSEFNAEKNNRNVLFSWETINEKNNDFFSIQRSYNGIDWETIRTIEGGGNSSAVRKYHAVDNKPLSGTSYYRLVQTDFDGAESYSEIEVIDFGTADTEFTVFPNPADEYIHISSGWESTSLKLYNSLGQEILDMPSAEGGIDVSGLSEGVYLLYLTDGVRSEKRNIVIRH